MKIAETLPGARALACGLLALALAGSADASQEQEAPVDTPTVVGSWQGTLDAMGQTLRVVFHITQDEDGSLTGTLDSPDQGAAGIPISSVTVEDHHLVIGVQAVAGEFEGDLAEDGTAIEGEWRQGGASLPLRLDPIEEGEAVEAPRRPQEPEPPLPYAVEDVRFPNPGAEITLAGTLTLPEGGGPHPAVVLVSGSGPQDRDEMVFGHRPFLVLADHLTRQGVAVLRYDDRGVAESTGDFGVATSEDFAADALAAVGYLSQRSEIDPGRVGIVGHSEGGLVAPMAAASSDAVAFIVLIAGPGITGEEILYRQGELINRANGVSEELIEENTAFQRQMFTVLRETDDLDAAAAKLRQMLTEAVAELDASERTALGIPADGSQFVEAQVGRLATPWFRFFLTYDPASSLQRVRVPVLAINGELDLQVPWEVNLEAIERALAAGGNPDVTIRPFPHLNHLLQTATTGSPSEYQGIEETMSPTALKHISDWILERFGGS